MHDSRSPVVHGGFGTSLILTTFPMIALSRTNAIGLPPAARAGYRHLSTQGWVSR